jgi:hypothetical protein
MDRPCSTHGNMRNLYRNLVGKPERKRPPGRPRRRRENNNQTGLREIGWGGIDCIDLAQNRDQWGGSCEHGTNLWVP